MLSRRPQVLLVGVMALGLAGLGTMSPARASTATLPAAHRVVIAGDSIEHQASTYEAAMLSATKQVRAKLITVPGISYCALWPSIARQLKVFKPEVVVLELVGTAYSPCAKRYGTLHSDAWFAAFGQALERGISAMAAAGVVKVQLDAGPTTKVVEDWKLRLIRLYDDLAAAHPGLVSQITPGAAVAGAGGTWVKYLPCLADEVANGTCASSGAPSPGTITVRSPDNFHLCTQPPVNPYSPVCPTYSSGAYRYAAATVAPIISDWGLSPVPVYLP